MAERGGDSAQWQCGTGTGTSVVSTALRLCLTAASRDDDQAALSLQECRNGAPDQARTLR